MGVVGKYSPCFVTQDASGTDGCRIEGVVRLDYFGHVIRFTS